MNKSILIRVTKNGKKKIKENGGLNDVNEKEQQTRKKRDHLKYENTTTIDSSSTLILCFTRVSICMIYIGFV